MNLKSQLSNFDIQQLSGLKLLQICRGLYQITFDFQNNISFKIGERVRIGQQGKHLQVWSYKVPRDSFEFGFLLEKAVKFVEVFSEKLTITFDDGYFVDVFSSEGGLESFIIVSEDNYLVIY